MLARIRKAVTAGIGAGVATGIGALLTAGPLNRAEASKALGAAILAAATTGWATWRVPNVTP